MKKVNNQKGFTIIELVVVILLLGILTATALPRFMDVSTQAHTAVVQAVQGSMQTAVALFNAAYTAQGEPAEDSAVTGFGDGSLLTNDVGFPKGNNATGITNNVGGAAECALIYSELLQVGGVPTIAAAGLAAVPDVAQFNGNAFDFLPYVTAVDICNFAYTGEPVPTGGGNARVITYNSTTGVVTLASVAIAP